MKGLTVRLVAALLPLLAAPPRLAVATDTVTSSDGCSNSCSGMCN